MAQPEMAAGRAYPNASGYLDAAAIGRPGTYGRATADRVQGTRAGWWQVTTPDGTAGSLNPAIHTVTEHEDGAITVTPSIDYSRTHHGGWHGWLTRGEFRSV